MNSPAGLTGLTTHQVLGVISHEHAGTASAQSHT
jgi:hypothetical protein